MEVNMKKLTLKTLAMLLTAVMLILPIPVSAEEGVTFEMGSSLLYDAENLVCTATYEACALDYTVYTFAPEDIGKYTISSNKLLGIVSYNGMWATIQPSETTVTETSITWRCSSVGQEIWVAVYTKGEAATISVEYESIEITTTPIVDYENKVAPEAFVFDGDAAALLNVPVQDETTDAPVMGPDGLYRLNSATGPRIFIDLNDEQLSLAAALDYGQLKVGVTNDEGKLDHYLNYCNAFSQYLECADGKTGLYPLTDDLIEMYQVIGEYKKWYGEGGWLSLTSEDAWMFACYYIEGDVYDDGTEEEWPITDVEKLAELNKLTFTANGRDTVALTANAEVKTVYSFKAWKKGTYTVLLEGTGTKEVWVVNSAGEIVASTEAAVTAKVTFDIEAAAGETYYVLIRGSHTADANLTLSVNYYSGVKGDVNGDGRLNSRDTMSFKKYMANVTSKDNVSSKGLDFDGNGRINSQDLMKMKKAI